MNYIAICADNLAKACCMGPHAQAGATELDRIMGGDRRNNGRAKLGRRRSARTILFTDVRWQGESGRALRGVVVGISDHGLAMLTDCRDTPRPGSCIRPRTHRARARWFRSAVVTRTESLSESLDLVAAEFPSVAAH